MRTAQFRAWDGERWWYEEVFLTGDGKLWFRGKGTHNMHFVSWTVCFFTGLYDTNGKEIWEGDIVENEGGDMTVIEYGFQEVDAFVGVGFNLWPFKDAPDDKGIHDASESALRQYKVIGNMFENPELVNK